MRCDGAGPASPQPVMARASSLRTAISHRDRSTDVTSGHGAPAAATMIAPAAFHDPAAARVATAARPGRSGGLPGSLRRERGRVDVTTSGCDPRCQRRLRPARCRRRGQGQYLGACARWRGRRSRCSSAPPSHCAWPPWTACPSCPLPHASRCARGLRHAYSPRARRRGRFSICRWLCPWHAPCLSLPPCSPPPPLPASALTWPGRLAGSCHSRGYDL